MIYVTPQGIPFYTGKARELAAQDELLLLCGHYEGIDERVLEEVVTDYISIGDYVLTGGELAAMVIVDAVARLVPGVLEMNSRPDRIFPRRAFGTSAIFQTGCGTGKKVPEVLLSGNQKHIDAWKRNSPSCVQKGTQTGSVCPLCAAAGMQTTAYETETVAHRYD